jgi:hypothetical protein
MTTLGCWPLLQYMTQICVHVIEPRLGMDALTHSRRSIAIVSKRKDDAVWTTTLIGESPCIILIYHISMATRWFVVIPRFHELVPKYE